MRVLVDTSVWSLDLLRRRGPGHPAAAKLRELLEEGEDVYITGIVLQELLQGVRSPIQSRRIRDRLTALAWLRPSAEDHGAAADLFIACRKSGVQIGTVDALIAALAIRGGCELLTTDQDFSRVASLSALRLLAI